MLRSSIHASAASEEAPARPHQREAVARGVRAGNSSHACRTAGNPRVPPRRAVAKHGGRLRHEGRVTVAVGGRPAGSAEPKRVSPVELRGAAARRRRWRGPVHLPRVAPQEPERRRRVRAADIAGRTLELEQRRGSPARGNHSESERKQRDGKRGLRRSNGTHRRAGATLPTSRVRPGRRRRCPRGRSTRSAPWRGTAGGSPLRSRTAPPRRSPS